MSQLNQYKREGNEGSRPRFCVCPKLTQQPQCECSRGSLDGTSFASWMSRCWRATTSFFHHLAIVSEEGSSRLLDEACGQI